MSVDDSATSDQQKQAGGAESDVNRNELPQQSGNQVGAVDPARTDSAAVLTRNDNGGVTDSDWSDSQQKSLPAMKTKDELIEHLSEALAEMASDYSQPVVAPNTPLPSQPPQVLPAQQNPALQNLPPHTASQQNPSLQIPPQQNPPGAPFVVPQQNQGGSPFVAPQQHIGPSQQIRSSLPPGSRPSQSIQQMPAVSVPPSQQQIDALTQMQNGSGSPPQPPQPSGNQSAWAAPPGVEQASGSQSGAEQRTSGSQAGVEQRTSSPQATGEDAQKQPPRQETPQHYFVLEGLAPPAAPQQTSDSNNPNAERAATDAGGIQQPSQFEVTNPVVVEPRDGLQIRRLIATQQGMAAAPQLSSPDSAQPIKPTQGAFRTASEQENQSTPVAKKMVQPQLQKPIGESTGSHVSLPPMFGGRPSSAPKDTAPTSDADQQKAHTGLQALPALPKNLASTKTSDNPTVNNPNQQQNLQVNQQQNLQANQQQNVPLPTAEKPAVQQSEQDKQFTRTQPILTGHNFAPRQSDPRSSMSALKAMPPQVPTGPPPGQAVSPLGAALASSLPPNPPTGAHIVPAALRENKESPGESATPPNMVPPPTSAPLPNPLGPATSRPVPSLDGEGTVVGSNQSTPAAPNTSATHLSNPLGPPGPFPQVLPHVPPNADTQTPGNAPADRRETKNPEAILENAPGATTLAQETSIPQGSMLDPKGTPAQANYAPVPKTLPPVSPLQKGPGTHLPNSGNITNSQRISAVSHPVISSANALNNPAAGSVNQNAAGSRNSQQGSLPTDPSASQSANSQQGSLPTNQSASQSANSQQGSFPTNQAASQLANSQQSSLPHNQSPFQAANSQVPAQATHNQLASANNQSSSAPVSEQSTKAASTGELSAAAANKNLSQVSLPNIPAKQKTRATYNDLREETGMVLPHTAPEPGPDSLVVNNEFGKSVPGVTPVSKPFETAAGKERREAKEREIEALNKIQLPAKFQNKNEEADAETEEPAPRAREQSTTKEARARRQADPGRAARFSNLLHENPGTSTGSRSLRASQSGGGASGAVDFLKTKWRVTIVAALAVVLVMSVSAVLLTIGKSFIGVSMSPSQRAGAEAFNEGNYDRAVSYFNEAIKADQKRPELYHDRARAYLRLQEYPEAVSDYSSALKLDPNFTSARLDRAAAYYYLTDYPKAIADYDELIKNDNQKVDAYFGRGLSYSKLNNYDKALEDLNKVVELKPQHPGAFEDIANAYLAQGKLNEAVDAYSRSLKNSPRDPNAFYMRGNTYRRLGKTTEALNDFSSAIDVAPGRYEFYNDRGFLQRENNKLKEAIADFGLALALKPNYEIARHNRASACQKLIASIGSASTPEALGDLAYADFNSEQYNEALAAANRALLINSQYRPAMNIRAAIELKQKKFDYALMDPDKILKIKADDRDALLTRARAYLNLGRYDSAIKDYDTCIAENANKSLFALRERTLAHLLANEGALAAADAQQFIDLNGWNNSLSGPTVLLGWLAKRQLQDLDGANAMLSQAETHLNSKQWPYPILKFLKREITLSQLNAGAQNLKEKTDVRTWSGFDHVLGGMRDEAHQDFEWVKRSGYQDNDDHLLAAQQLKTENE